MAFMTNYTYGKLCRTVNLNTEVNLELFLAEVFDDKVIFHILNKLEREYLFKFKNILEDEEKYLAQYFVEVEEREDTETYVFEQGGKAKYHLFEECNSLSKDFLDFPIPDEIQKLGSDAVAEYRDWFKSNNFREKFLQKILDGPAIIYRYNQKYPEKYEIPHLNENFKLITIIPNSQFTREEEDFDYDQFLIELIQLKDEYFHFFNGKADRLISKFDYLVNKSENEIEEKINELFEHPDFFKNQGLSRIMDKFRKSRKIKTRIIKNLIDYFKWKFKYSEKNFNSATLEEFGLECCGNCSRQNTELKN